MWVSWSIYKQTMSQSSIKMVNLLLFLLTFSEVLPADLDPGLEFGDYLQSVDRENGDIKKIDILEASDEPLNKCFPLEKPLERNFALCFMVYPSFTGPVGITVETSWMILNLEIYQTDYTIGSKFYQRFESNKWFHLCVFKGEKEEVYENYFQTAPKLQLGEQFFKSDGEKTMKSSEDLTESSNETICYNLLPRAGSLAFLSLASTNDTHEDSLYKKLRLMQEEKLCSSYLNETMIHGSFWKLLNDSGSTAQISVNEMCQNFFHFRVYEGHGSYNSHMSRCRVLKGRLLYKDEMSFYSSYYNDTTISRFSSCNLDKTYQNKTTDPLYIVLMGGRLRFWLLGPQVQYMHWEAPNTFMLVGNQASLEMSFECYACLIPRRLGIKINGNLGDCHREMTLSGREAWEGSDMSLISSPGNSWRLTTCKNLTFDLDWSDSLPPLGRNNWMGRDGTKMLALSTCTDREFVCSDGACVPIESRCNGTSECNDFSDEVECVLLTKPPGYLSLQAPRDANLTYDIVVHSMQDISISERKTDLEMTITFYWNDERLTLGNSQSDSVLNCSDIWYPKMKIMSSCSRGYTIKTDLKQECFPNPSIVNFERYDRNSPYLDRSRKNPLLKTRIEVSGSIPCRFDLSQYPFGRPQCSFCIVTQSILKSYTENADLYYEGNYHLGEVHLQNITGHLRYDMNKIIVSLQFQTISMFHIVNTFIPSGIICAICYTTLFFHVKEFNERVMVSLTSVLVLVALFAQVAQTSVRTPYPKLLELWYIYLMGFCFLVVIFHTVLQKIVHKISERTCSQNDEVSKKLAWVLRLSQIFFLLVFIGICYGFRLLSE